MEKYKVVQCVRFEIFDPGWPRALVYLVSDPDVENVIPPCWFGFLRWD